ncbi:MAG: 3-keto-5-aminohexanoate cleavage protein [Clostridiales Family XIII bacterium]|jgi:3-keto-5-aminohexanoate cleavage enzyme|nr:3-keto-5-aminohexanoate cleavage protein [Clostridiales Family XIII bacterium]
MDKLIITAAICGAEVSKKKNPAVPYTVSEIAREAKLAYDAGASVLHLHVREDDGSPTQSKERFAACIDAVKAVCPDMIIQPSTGGAVWMSAAERLQPVELNPEYATLSCGTCNFGGDAIFINTETMIIEFAEAMRARNVVPECEVFDKGMIDMAVRLWKKGLIPGDRLRFNFVMGITGAIEGAARDLVFLQGSIPEDSLWTVSGIGRREMPLAAMAISMGGHVRVGFEDNVFLEKGVLAESNAQLVEKVVKLAQLLDRKVATPDEARAILGLSKR